jgi:hypothetical protein
MNPRTTAASSLVIALCAPIPLPVYDSRAEAAL